MLSLNGSITSITCLTLYVNLKWGSYFFTRFAFPQLPSLWSGRYNIFLSHINMIQEIKESFFLIGWKTSNVCVPNEKSCLIVNIFEPCWSKSDSIISYRTVAFVCVVNCSRCCYDIQFDSIIHHQLNQKILLNLWFKCLLQKELYFIFSQFKSCQSGVVFKTSGQPFLL